MKRITQQMIEVSYEYGKTLDSGEIILSDAVEQVVIKSGMNRGSASKALQNMKCLLNEEVYFNMMSANETIWRLEEIKKDFGSEKYFRVLKIVEKHIDSKNSPQIKIREYVNKNKTSTKVK